MTTPLLPVHEVMREDAALGAAWRRCEAALPDHHGLTLTRHLDRNGRSSGYIVGLSSDDGPSIWAPTADEALTRFADALESRGE